MGPGSHKRRRRHPGTRPGFQDVKGSASPQAAASDPRSILVPAYLALAMLGLRPHWPTPRTTDSPSSWSPPQPGPQSQCSTCSWPSLGPTASSPAGHGNRGSCPRYLKRKLSKDGLDWVLPQGPVSLKASSPAPSIWQPASQLSPGNPAS